MPVAWGVFISTLLHPVFLLVVLLTVGGWLLIRLRLRKLDAILAELEGLPPGKRRYQLERTHKMFPRREQKPLAFVRFRRRLTLHGAAAVSILAGAALATGIIREVVAATATDLELEESEPSAQRRFYTWQLRILNHGSSTAVIEELGLRIRNRRRHPESDRPSVPAGSFGSGQRVVLDPVQRSVEIIGRDDNRVVDAEDSLLLNLALEADHKPQQGWVYEVEPYLKWRPSGHATVLSRTGTRYRIGWAGMRHWSAAPPAEGRTEGNLTDPPQKLSP